MDLQNRETLTVLFGRFMEGLKIDDAWACLERCVPFATGHGKKDGKDILNLYRNNEHFPLKVLLPEVNRALQVWLHQILKICAIIFSMEKKTEVQRV